MKRSFLRLILPLSVLVVFVATSAHTEDKKNSDDVKKVRLMVPKTAPAKPGADRKILVFSKTNGFRHGSIDIGARAMKMLGRKTGAFKVVHSEDEALFEPESLKKFDAVLMLNTTGEVFRPKDLPADEDAKKAALEREERLKKSLVDFVKGGKGLIGLHSATDTYKNWKDYNDMMGGAFDGHPWHTWVPLRNLDPDNPVNKSFGKKEFYVIDEIYQFRNDTASPDDRRMLLSLDGNRMDLSKGKRKDGFYPISWMQDYGEGRVFYCSLGHRNEIFWNTTVLKHYLAGIQYALGDLKAEASPKSVK